MTEKQYFGTDGIRGHVGGDVMNVEFILKLGWAIGSVLVETVQYKPHVLIGRDTRISGEMLQSALVAGLFSAGVDVSILGVIATPAVAFFTKELNATAGIVISASHNPYEDNGIKLIGQNALKLSDEMELLIEKKLSLSLTHHTKIGHSIPVNDAISEYVLHCKKLFNNDFSLSNKKIVIDCANGATSGYASEVFVKFGADIILINAEPNGFNINAHSGATDIVNLKKTVLNERADCGLALDGDGDRLIMVDHLGESVDGDEILCMIATHTLDKKNNAVVVGTLMSNLGLEKALQSQGISLERVAVGDRYVLAKMQEKNLILGGEGSGHIVNLNYSTTGDGIITALQVLQIMQNTQKSLHELKKIMQKRPQILINVPVKEPKLYSTMTAISKALKIAENNLGEAGRILLRPSGTESCVRVMVECDDEGEAKLIAEGLAKVVEDAFKEPVG